MSPTMVSTPPRTASGKTNDIAIAAALINEKSFAESMSPSFSPANHVKATQAAAKIRASTPMLEHNPAQFVLGGISFCSFAGLIAWLI